MNYVVFEAGSRAGFSAEMFFLDYLHQTGNFSETLYMIDDSFDVNKIEQNENVVRLSYNDFLDLDSDSIVVFPADELSRQSKLFVERLASIAKFSAIDNNWYNKKLTNEELIKLTKCCKIRIPRTFAVDSVCVRPNTMSAGSKGVQLLDNVCVSERINIAKEYVIDVVRGEHYIQIYPREVILKNGYDRLIRPLEANSKIGDAVKEFIFSVCPENNGFYSCIFHLQIAEDTNGELYYIESSKRISGTSIVNIFRGMNPFCHIQGYENNERENPFKYDKWYRYEDFIKELKV